MKTKTKAEEIAKELCDSVLKSLQRGTDAMDENYSDEFDSKKILESYIKLSTCFMVAAFDMCTNNMMARKKTSENIFKCACIAVDSQLKGGVY